jgi:hypothetical protein
MARRRRGGEDAVTIIYWRDIPAQVTARAGSETHKALLEDRFQQAIDRAATVAGLTETGAYVAQWRRASEPLEGDPPDVAGLAGLVADRATELTMAYPRPRLEALVAAGGLEPTIEGRDRGDSEDS